MKIVEKYSKINLECNSHEECYSILNKLNNIIITYLTLLCHLMLLRD